MTRKEMKRKISTKDIYLCELGLQKLRVDGEIVYKSVIYLDNPVYIWAYKKEEIFHNHYTDIFNGSTYWIYNAYANNGEFVVIPIKPIFFIEEKITIAEAKRLFDMTFEDAMIEKLKNYVERYPSFEEKIRKEVLLEDTNEINNTKGKIRKLTR